MHSKKLISSSCIQELWFSKQVGYSKYEILPDGCSDIVFELSQEGVFSSIYGTTTQSKKIILNENASYLGIKLKPGVEMCTKHFKPQDLINNSIGLERNELDLELPSFFESLRQHHGALEKLKFTQEFFEKKEIFYRDERVSTILDYIHLNDGNVAIGNLVKNFKLSEKQIERIFQQRTGITPKLYCRIHRFQKVMSAIKLNKLPSMCDFAHHFGFSDQAHMIRDFRALSGKTPTKIHQS